MNILKVKSDRFIKREALSSSHLNHEDTQKLCNAVTAVDKDGSLFKGVIIREFRKGRSNAAMLPDGRLLISDKIVQNSDQNQLTATIGHEAGHLKGLNLFTALEEVKVILYRGALVSAICYSVLVAPVAPLALTIGGCAAYTLLIAERAYVRRRELNADLNALKYVSRKDIISSLSIDDTTDEQLLASFSKVQRFLFKSILKPLELMSSHPSLEKRIRNIQKHSEQGVVHE